MDEPIWSNILREMDEANQAHVVNYMAIGILLLEKGIITHKELQAKQMLATSIVEQEVAKRKEELKNDFVSTNPELHKALTELLGEDYYDL